MLDGVSIGFGSWCQLRSINLEAFAIDSPMIDSISVQVRDLELVGAASIRCGQTIPQVVGHFVLGDLIDEVGIDIVDYPVEAAIVSLLPSVVVRVGRWGRVCNSCYVRRQSLPTDAPSHQFCP